MKESNLINLVDHIEKNTPLTTEEFNKDKKENKVTLTKRVYSFIIDYACILTIHAAILVAYTMFITEFYYGISPSSKAYLISMPIVAQLALFMTSYVGYFMFTQATMDGQTIGQKVYSLKVCCENGFKKDDFKTVSLRTFAYTTYYFGMGIPQIVFFMSKEKRSFADTLSKSFIQTDYNISKAEVVEIDIESLDSAA